MRLCRYCWVACLAFLILFRGEAFAAAVPAYTGKMNTAVGGVISQKVSKWGFAANDPRFGATMTGVGAGVTTLVVGGLGVAVGAATWPAVLVGAGITSLVSGAVSWGQDSLYKWMFNSDGTVSSQGGSGGVQYNTPVPPASMTAGGPYWSSGSYTAGDYFTAASANLLKCPGAYCSDANNVYSLEGCTQNGTSVTCQMRLTHPNLASCGSACDSVWSVGGGYYSASGAPSSCVAGSAYNGSSCAVAPLPTTDTSAPTVTNVPVGDAVANIPDSELAKPLSNEMLAAAANAAWKAMAANAPNALPWSATDPITPADVADWKAANPNSVPNVGDAIGPVASPGSSAVPISQPGTYSPSTGPATTPGQGTQVDLGPNPNTPPPGLEATPTAQQIMDPLLNLMPDLRNFSVPSHSAECPKGSFDALGKTYTIDSHCQLIENNRAIIEAAMLLVWAIASIFIVLRA